MDNAEENFVSETQTPAAAEEQSHHPHPSDDDNTDQHMESTESNDPSAETDWPMEESCAETDDQPMVMENGGSNSTTDDANDPSTEAMASDDIDEKQEVADNEDAALYGSLLEEVNVVDMISRHDDEEVTAEKEIEASVTGINIESESTEIQEVSKSSLPPKIDGSCRYFVVKPSTVDDIAKSLQGGTLSTSSNVINKVKTATSNLPTENIIFFVILSGYRFFNGYSKILFCGHALR
jgi:hypothetical protein